MDKDPNAICYECLYHGTMDCPPSIECYAKNEKPKFKSKNKKRTWIQVIKDKCYNCCKKAQNKWNINFI